MLSGCWPRTWGPALLSSSQWPTTAAGIRRQYRAAARNECRLPRRGRWSGSAGLSLATQLRNYGASVTVLEARGRVGAGFSALARA